MLQNLLYQTATIQRVYVSTDGYGYGYDTNLSEDLDYTTVLSDSYGQPIKVWSDLSTVPCRLEDIQSKEILDGKEVIITERLCYMNNTDITEADRVVIESITYYPKKLMRATGMRGIDHIEVYLVQKDKT